MVRLNAKQLRVSLPSEEDLKSIQHKPIWIVLDNVLDTYNIGGIFRLAEAIAASEVILCGGSETPPSSRIHKAAVGTEMWVPWRYEADARTAILNIKEQIPNIKIIAVEQDENAIPISKVKALVSNDQPIAIVVGHETDGVSADALKMADVIAEIPMWGVNKSLNVIVSTAIAAYQLTCRE
ncbi:MAG: TrmH family RNA methyltransferase [Patescibacteria group bacterium]